MRDRAAIPKPKTAVGGALRLARTSKRARDLHLLRERGARSRTETWSRPEIEQLFGVGRATAQTLMKAIGGVQTVAGAHFVERSSLLAFLEEVAAAPSVEEAMRDRLVGAEPVPRPKTLRVALPPGLRHAMLPDLPANVTVEAGRIEVRATTAVEMLEGLAALAMVMRNDLERFREVIELRRWRSECLTKTSEGCSNTGETARTLRTLHRLLKGRQAQCTHSEVSGV